ncbi:YmfQ family protein [Clostridium sp.]|uniref:YmfQ family protein n=1 Tax=Clostridium sp. TaxID=1506 RepID=UPI002FCC4F3E
MDRKTTLLSYMPLYYRKSKIIDNINSSNALELNRFHSRLDNILNQFFIDKADFTLERWESELGLDVNNNLNVDYRRSRIKSKLRGQGTVTVSLIRNVAESFSNGEVDLIENNAAYEFTIKFVGVKGIPPNMEDLKKAIEEIKPAHLNYKFEYTYLTWDEFEKYNRTWDQWDVLNLTWDELEVHIY